jgi:hypothetical protein
MTVVTLTAHPAPASLRLLLLLLGLFARGLLLLGADPVLRLPLADLTGGDPLEQLLDGAADLLR